MDVATFLARHPPFDALAEDRLREVAGTVEVEHVPAGETILRPEGEPARELSVIRKGAVEAVRLPHAANGDEIRVHAR